MNDELIPLSYLSQYGYCPRRAGLLLLESMWAENIYTVEGSIAHERAHAGGAESRSNCIKMFDAHITSASLGLSGKTDCIEAHADINGVSLPQYNGKFRLYPVEYKHGISRNEREYQVQLCGQAVCLEEMLGCRIEVGALYFIGSKKRNEIVFDQTLRNEVKHIAKRLHEMLETKLLPSAKKGRKCNKCSLYDLCMPTIARKYAAEYVNNILEWAKEGDEI